MWHNIYPLNRNAIKPIGHAPLKNAGMEMAIVKLSALTKMNYSRKDLKKCNDLCIDLKYNAWLKKDQPDSLVHETPIHSFGYIVAEYLYVAPLSPIPIDTKSSFEVTRIPLEPSGVGMNALITLASLQPSAEGMNASTTEESVNNYTFTCFCSNWIDTHLWV